MKTIITSKIFCCDSNSFGFDDFQPPQYTVNHPIFNTHHDYLDSEKELSTTITKLKEQMTSLTLFCEMTCQIIKKKLEEKQIEEEQASKAHNRKLPVCYDDDDDKEESNSLKDNNVSELPPCSPITPSEPIDSLSMGDEHLDTILATKSNEVIKSSVENLVPNPSESEGENGCDVPSCFTTFSNILFDDEYKFDSIDDQSLHNEDFSEKIFSNLLFEEEISSIKKNQHYFNAESDLVESMLNHDSSIIFSSSKIDSLLDEFTGELTLLKSIPPGVDKTDCHPKNEIRLSQRLLYDNSSPQPPEEFVFENSNAKIESFSPSPIPNKDSDSHMEEINLSFNPDDPMPPNIEDDDDSERDILFLERLLHDDPIPLPDTLDFSYEVKIFLPFFTYPLSSISGNLKTLAKGFYPPSLNFISFNWESYQVKSQKIQAGVQVSRLEDKDVIFSTGSTLEVFILFVFVLDRNMNTLAEYMILSGADNRPPMLDKDLYDSWKSRMELYMQNRGTEE
uniref:Uncharacterized protein n=1 Tax=Tanacetum cinerariifolium TaxID=118510 RepID=A0A699IJ69_TANCI|nr:hypothetical protein [Tanacetum cinerariifolium]